MNKLIVLTSVMTLLLPLTALAGVAVGNGQSAYVTDQGFGVRYASSLTLTQPDGDHFAISNADLVPAESPTSRITFNLNKTHIGSLAALKIWARANYPHHHFKPIKLDGAQGLASETRSRDRLQGVYVLLTTNFDLVEVKVDAFAAGNGIGLITPIVHSFTYDLTAPEIDEMRLDTHHWVAGQSYKLYFRAHDDFSGIKTSSVGGGFEREGSPPRAENGGIGSEWNSYKDEGGGWISITFTLKPFIRPGTYLMSGAAIFDNADNRLSLTLNRASGLYEAEPTYAMDGSVIQPIRKTNIRALRIEVTNPGAFDDHGPILHEVRFDRSTWLTGETHRIYVRATDDVSGIDPAATFAIGLNLNGRSYPGIWSHNARAEGDDWYSFELTADKFIADGEYTLESISLYDRAGNRSRLDDGRLYGVHDGYYHLIDGEKEVPIPKVPLFKVHVHNPDLVDTTGPEILGIKVDGNTWTAGSTVRFHFKARDTQSGMVVGARKSLLPDGTFGLFYLLPVNTSSSYFSCPMTKEIVSDGDDWYHADMKMDRYLKPGHYVIGYITIDDVAGNATTIKCLRKDWSIGRCRSANGPSLDAIHISVVQ